LQTVFIMIEKRYLDHNNDSRWINI